MTTLRVVLPTLIHREVSLIQQEGELMLMKVTDSDMKGILPLLLQVTVKGVHVNMTISGSKRPYAALDDVPPHYADAAIHQSRARLDYEYGSGSSQYGDGYSDRLGRSSMGYGSSRTSQDSHGPYSNSSRQGIDYGGGSYGGNGGGGMYSSSYGSDVGGSSYSSMYSGRCVGGSSYMGSGVSGSYY
ncbi:hypothetical protein ACFX2A_028449 [Malus domestica]